MKIYLAGNMGVIETERKNEKIYKQLNMRFLNG